MAQKLLVPLDGSELAEAVLPYAISLARAQDLSLVLARVILYPMNLWVADMGAYLPPEVFQRLYEEDRADAAAYLAGMRERLASTGVPVETVSQEGVPAPVILDLADEWGVSAIALATRGRGGLARLVLGSVAEGVLQQATLPLLLVHARPGPPAAPAALTRVLVPLDGSGFAELALTWAQDLVPQGGSLILVRVVAPAEHLLPALTATQGFRGEDAARRMHAEAEAYLDRLAQERSRSDVTLRTTVRMGHPSEQILAAAREYAADLIVLSTHGRTGLRRAIMGSVADSVLRETEAPVLLVSARALATQAAWPLTVWDAMTHNVAPIRADERLATAAQKLLRRASAAPVVDAEGRLVGVLSEHDLLAWAAALPDVLAQDPGSAPSELARRLERATVGQVMSHASVTIGDSAPLAAAIRLLVERQLRLLPVTSEGNLVGVLTRADVLESLIQRARAQEGTLGSRQGYPPAATNRRGQANHHHPGPASATASNHAGSETARPTRPTRA
jgi:nucleotide-binding universal stress UspA family protein/predicted transcriptional regulator